MSTNQFDKFIPAFSQQLQLALPHQLEDLYPRKYLEHLLSHCNYYLGIYSQLLNKLFSSGMATPNAAVLVDFGAGNGLLGLFAKFCGIRTVYINDRDPHFLNASKILAAQLGITIDGFIEGDIDSVARFPFTTTPGIIAGTDVIEHIYDLDIFFETIRKINPKMLTGFTTASNPYNKAKVSKLMKLQRQDEYEGSDGLNPEHPIAHPSFSSLRRSIIAYAYPGIPAQTLGQLTKKTRGLVKKDILLYVEAYLKTGGMPTVMRHPTNTCDPFNGSWTERILPIEDYRKIFEKQGFKLECYHGFYDDRSSGRKKLLNRLLNMGVWIFGKNISPFIGIIGSPK